MAAKNKVKQPVANKKRDDFEAEMQEIVTEYIEEENKVKLSKAERKNAKRKQELLNQYELEQKLCEINMKKVCDKWEKFLGAAKLQEVSGHWEELRESIDRYKNIKDQIVCLLMGEFDEIADCKSKLAASFIYALDRLLEIGTSRVRRLRGEFQKNLSEEIFKSKRNISEIEENENKTVESLQLTIFQQGESSENGKFRESQLHEEAILGLKSQFWMETEKMESEVDEAYEWLIVEMQTRIKSFLYFTKPQRMEVQVLRNKDNAFKLERDKDFMRCKMLQSEAKVLLKRLEKAEERKMEEENVRQEKKQLVRKYASLQSIMKDNQDADRKKLKLLTILADDTIQNLSKKLATVDRIIRIKEQCRLYETTGEHEIQRSNIYGGLKARQGASILNGFVAHLGKVQLSFREAQTELVSLKEENLELRKNLGTHFLAIKYGES